MSFKNTYFADQQKPVSMPFFSSPNTKLRLVGPPVLFLFGAIFFRLRQYLLLTPANLVATSLIGIVLGYMGWEIARLTITYWQTQYPGLTLVRKRLWWILATGLLLVVVNAAFRFSIILLLNSASWTAGYINFYDLVEIIGIQLFYNSVYIGIYEGGYLLAQWQETFREKERALKVEWQTRFEALKQEVSPHFLFNALNSLSSLIDESPTQAGQFVDELAKVYRYLLQVGRPPADRLSSAIDTLDKESGLVNLSEELQFIDSYRHLLQTQHGAGLSVSVNVSPLYQTYRLPALALQLLVENAVKHNVATWARPLRIDITATAGDRLCVRNNRQKKQQRVLSTGVGLSNIVTRYQMVTEAEVRVEENESYFAVEIPLLPAASTGQLA